MRRAKLVWMGTIFALVVGCSHGPSKSALKTAINDYYSVRNECVWPQPVKFPVQMNASDNTRGYDALTDAGLLTRKAEQEKRLFAGSKQVNIYDLSAKGHSSWTPDSSNPGYGNFCFGHRHVTTVDHFTAGEQNGVSTAFVSYHYDLTKVPDWAKSAEMQTAFPNLKADLSGSPTATANLEKTTNGWQVKRAG